MNNISYFTSMYGAPRQRRNDVPISQLLKKRQVRLRSNTQKGDVSFLAHLSAFAGDDVTIRKITTKFCRQFAEYLIQHVRINSARTYLQKLHAILHEAIQMNYIIFNPMPPISELLPRYIAPERAYLTVNEINRLKDAECPHQSTKLAFLFSCYTGLRISDIETLKWDHIHRRNNITILIKTQVKTNQEVRIPLGIEALKILSQVKTTIKKGNHVFKLCSRTTICSDLLLWAETANIRKHVTFHVARHSFATLAISAGVSLYTVSKLCGHTNIKTTQIYAKMMDSTRVKAIACLDKLFSGRACKKLNETYDLMI